MLNTQGVLSLEKEKRLFPRKRLERAFVKEYRERCMNLNEGVGLSTIYGKGKEPWLRRGKKNKK